MQQTTGTTPFGHGLRHWRRIRGVSQLDLAVAAQTTTRHVSYLETGRSRPSAAMVARLSDALTIPLRERNRLLQMAGLARSYPEGDLASDDLAPFQRIVDRLLDSHAPYPGLVIDRHWNIVATNLAAHLLFGASQQRNTVRLLLDDWREVIDNWVEMVLAAQDRLANDLLRFPDDETLRSLYHDLRDAHEPRPISTERPTGRVICPRFHIDGQLIRTVTVAARFESATDITLDELRIELIYPEDDTAERFFRQQANAQEASKV